MWRRSLCHIFWRVGDIWSCFSCFEAWRHSDFSEKTFVFTMYYRCAHGLLFSQFKCDFGWKTCFYHQKLFTFDHFFDQNGIRKTSGVPLTTSGVTMGRLDDVSVVPEGRQGIPWGGPDLHNL